MPKITVAAKVKKSLNKKLIYEAKLMKKTKSSLIEQIIKWYFE